MELPAHQLSRGLILHIAPFRHHARSKRCANGSLMPERRRIQLGLGDFLFEQLLVAECLDTRVEGVLRLVGARSGQLPWVVWFVWFISVN